MHTPEYGAAFIGVIVGGILYGMTILQATSYFRRYRSDPLWTKSCVGLLCLLDTLHLCFSIHMMYFYLIHNFGNVKAVFDIIWSLKGLGTVQVLLIWLVQCLYLTRIWKLSRKIVNNAKISSALLAGLIVTVVVAFGVGTMFIIKMDELRQGLSMAGFRWAIFFGFSVTIAVDVFIAGVMSFLLYRSQTGMKRTDSMLFTLIQYVIGTGVLTSAASIIYVILYVAKPDSLLYLAQEFSITRLYTNSYLAMMNARSGLRGQMCEPVDIEINLTNAIQFASPSSSSYGDKTRKLYQTPPETPIKLAKTSLEDHELIPPPPCLGHDDYNRSKDILLDRVQ